MNISKTTKIYLISIAVVLLIVSVVSLIIIREITKQKNGGVTAETGNYDITGKWYSGHGGGDMLILEQDGNYTSSSWFASGSFAVDGDAVTLTDVFGDSRTLTVTELDGIYVLRYNGAAAYTYYRSEYAAASEEERQNAEDEARQGHYEYVLMQILTTGEWVNDDGQEKNRTAVFTENTITFSFPGNEYTDADTREYSYTIISAEEINGDYVVKLDMRDETLGYTYYNNVMSVNSEENNIYTIHCGNFMFAVKYAKTLE